ncbi:MAG: hypothetical protein V8Q54_07160 [Alistipes senegalensis]
MSVSLGLELLYPDFVGLDRLVVAFERGGDLLDAGLVCAAFGVEVFSVLPGAVVFGSQIAAVAGQLEIFLACGIAVDDDIKAQVFLFECLCHALFVFEFSTNACGDIRSEVVGEACGDGAEMSPDEPIVDFTVAAHDFRAVLHGFEVEKTLVCGVGDGQFAGISVGGRNFGPAVFQDAFSVEVEPCSERGSFDFSEGGRLRM